MSKHWGASEADLYTAALRQYAAAIVDRPEIGVPVDAAPDTLSARAVRHFFFYRVIPDEIRIVRILHEQKDALVHLAEQPDALLPSA